jgi:hypothetical protein
MVVYGIPQNEVSFYNFIITSKELSFNFISDQLQNLHINILTSSHSQECLHLFIKSYK